MKFSSRDRFTLFSYLLIIGGLVVIVGIAARDVLFERFTFRIGTTIVSDSDLVYVIGGRSLEGDDYREILMVDPDQARIGQARGLEFDLFGYAAAGTADGLVIMGGNTRDGYSDVIYAFDPRSEEITQIGTLPYPVAYGTASVINGAVYYVGGYDGTSRRSEIIRVDAETGSATVVARLPEPRDGHAAVAYQNRLFLLGGDGDGGRRFADLLEVDPENGTVVRSREFPFPVRNASMAISGSRLIVLATDDQNRDLMLTLDLSVAESSQMIERPVDLDVRSTSVVMADGQLLAIGGAHPTASRQIGVWALMPNSSVVRPLRYHSRVWQ